MSLSESLKKRAAEAALSHIPKDCTILGIGTGSTVNYLIDALPSISSTIDGFIASSEATASRLRQYRLPIIDFNAIDVLPIYIDGTDEINRHGQLIKGGGGALTREKLLATSAKQFIVIAHETKYVSRLGNFPMAIEVLPMARSFVAREILKLGGDPIYRQGFITDNGNIILDVHHFMIEEPMALETTLQTIPGIIECGLFAKRRANLAIIAKKKHIIEYQYD